MNNFKNPLQGLSGDGHKWRIPKNIIIEEVSDFLPPVVIRRFKNCCEYSALTMLQNDRFNEEKQSLCTCVLNSGPFLSRFRQNNNVK